MNEKTKLEADLEYAHSKGRNHNFFKLLLICIIASAIGYAYYNQHTKLIKTQEELKTLNSKLEAVSLEKDALQKELEKHGIQKPLNLPSSNNTPAKDTSDNEDVKTPLNADTASEDVKTDETNNDTAEPNNREEPKRKTLPPPKTMPKN
ncbi:hypothetical protein MCHI_002700 [Candidatus Magnetoovum chiemensis]|nr:hypothetical protein MCHI_002700 [Candidatus Magnetoovum chiemensis]